MTVRFDDSLPRFAALLGETVGENLLRDGVILRDVYGRLAFFSSLPLEGASVETLRQRAQVELAPYARTDRIIAGPDEYGVAAVLTDPGIVAVAVGDGRVRLLDRRLVGTDWLRRPAGLALPPPRFVFASVKGGVGRSTALSVVAADLAAAGKRVLVVDLDMEAPGLGAILLDEENQPEFGTVDALVECAFAPLDPAFLADLVSASPLAHQKGRIDVVPAFGRRSLGHPGDVLAKIARAYAEGPGPEGQTLTILDRVRGMIEVLADPMRYDAVLIDARAGLHETAASAIQGLGAEVFLFGLDERQTFQGFSALLAHLARFVDPGAAVPEWLERLTLVQAKAPGDAEARAEFIQRCADLFVATGLAPRPEPPQTVPLPAGSFSDVPWDDEERTDHEILSDDEASARSVLAILDDQRFQRFDPFRRRDLLSESLYRTTFGTLIDHVRAIVRVEED